MGNTVQADRVIVPPVEQRPERGTRTHAGHRRGERGLRQAVAYATSRGEESAIAFYDTATGTYLSAEDADTDDSTASVIKLFIAKDLLLTGQMTGDIASAAYQIIAGSDDDTARSTVWSGGVVGATGRSPLLRTTTASPTWTARPQTPASGARLNHVRRTRTPLRQAQSRSRGLAVAVDGNRYALVILTYGSTAQYGQYMRIATPSGPAESPSS